MFANSPWLIMLLAFGAVAIVVFLIGQFVATLMRVQQRVAGAAASSRAKAETESNLDAFVGRFFEERRFGVDSSMRAKLRRDLVRAGFFRPNAINYYIFFRVVTAIAFPLVAYLFVERHMAEQEWYLKFVLVAVAMLTGIAGPDAYVARRQRVMHANYRVAFPDMLDLMVVCVDAGLSLEAALERISSQIMLQNRALGTNLMILGAETRAGRTTVDALDSLADRVALDEARSLVAMMRQSIELGTDVGDALRIFGDEMRDRRLLRAEERANQLPVKMVGPLGLFIFPVILMLVMIPILIRLFSVLT